MGDGVGNPALARENVNRTIWIWRIIAVLILLLCGILLVNLYNDLVQIRQKAPPTQQAPAAAPPPD